MSSQSLYLNTKPSKLFWKAAIPGGISMLASSLYTIFDTLFIGKLIGTTALAALGLAMPLIIINFALSELVGVGSSVPISIFLGKKEEDKANNYFTSSVLLIVFTGILSGALIYCAAPAFMRLMGAEGELLDYAVDYVRVYAVFSPITPLMFAMDNFLRISGKIKTSMALNIVASALTVITELLLIVVFDMKVVGAALGASLSMAACVAVALVMFVPGKLQLKYVKPKISKEMLIQIYKNGMAPFFTNISGRIFSVVMNVLLMSFSTEKGEAVAIYGVIMTLGGVVEQILYGVVDSLQPSLGYNYGAQHFDRVKTIEKYAMGAAAVISLAGAAVMFAIPGPLSIPFLEDRNLLDATIFAVRVSATTYLFKWIGVAIRCFFMALERPMPAMILSMADACVIPLAIIPLLMPFELTGLWLNYPVRTLLVGVLSVLVLWKLKDKLFTVTPNEKKEGEIE